MKHTKGPYRVSGSRMIRKGFQNPMIETAYEDSAPLLAEVLGQDRPWDEKVATAMLLAAAPELLEALENCFPAIEAYAKQVEESHGTNHDYAVMWQSSLAKARKAIANAKGISA